MTKPTIDDFINNPSNAVRKGYRPDFISVGILAASAFGINGFISIKESFISVIYGKVIEFPKNLICFFLNTFFALLMPICLPFWWVVGCLVWRAYYKKAKQQEERLNKLL